MVNVYVFAGFKSGQIPIKPFTAFYRTRWQSKIIYIQSGLKVFIHKFVDPLVGFNHQHIIMVTW